MVIKTGEIATPSAPKDRVTQLEMKTNDLISKSQSLIVKDEDTFLIGDDWEKTLLKLKKDIEDFYKDDIQNAYRTWKGLTAKRNSFLTPVDNAIRQLKRKMSDYRMMLERKRKQKEAEERAKADENARKERERLEKKAEKAEKSGKTEKAEEFRQEAEDVVSIAPKMPEPELPKGTYFKKSYVPTVVDFAALPDEYKKADMSLIKKVVNAHQGKKVIPGVKISVDMIKVTKRV